MHGPSNIWPGVHSLSRRDMVVKIVRALEAHGAGYVRDLIVVRRFIFICMPRHGPVSGWGKPSVRSRLRGATPPPSLS